MLRNLESSLLLGQASVLSPDNHPQTHRKSHSVCVITPRYLRKDLKDDFKGQLQSLDKHVVLKIF